MHLASWVGFAPTTPPWRQSRGQPRRACRSHCDCPADRCRDGRPGSRRPARPAVPHAHLAGADGAPGDDMTWSGLSSPAHLREAGQDLDQTVVGLDCCAAPHRLVGEVCWLAPVAGSRGWLPTSALLAPTRASRGPEAPGRCGPERAPRSPARRAVAHTWARSRRVGVGGPVTSAGTTAGVQPRRYGRGSVGRARTNDCPERPHLL